MLMFSSRLILYDRTVQNNLDHSHSNIVFISICWHACLSVRRITQKATGRFSRYLENRQHKDCSRHRMWSRVYVTVGCRPSVCLSRRSTVAAASSWFASERGREQQILIGICGRRVQLKKVAHTRLARVGFRNRSRFLAVSLQVT